MSVQVSKNNSNLPFVLESGLTVENDQGVLFQDAGRAADLVFGTALAMIVVTKKLVPYSNEAAIDGSAIPHGVYTGETILAADIVAGDVADVQYIKGGACMLDKNQLVIENAKTLDTVIGAGTLTASTVEKEFNKLGIFFAATESITGFEN